MLDDYFPCINVGSNKFKPVYAHSDEDELWVLLLEKAYAKLCGSYSRLESGRSYEALIDLTGAPVMSILVSDDKYRKMIPTGELWGMLKKYDDLKYIICVATFG